MGVTGVGTLAGCLGDDDDGSDIEDEDGNGNDTGDEDGNGNDTDDDDGDGDDPEDLLGDDLEDMVEEVDYNENYEEEYNEAVVGNDENPFDGEFVFNPFSPRWSPGDVAEHGFEYLAVFHAEEGFVPRIAEGWEHDIEAGRTTVEISDEYAWSTGESITAEDFVNEIKLNIYMDEPLGEFIAPEGVYAEDDTTLVVEARDEFVGMEEGLWYNQWLEMSLQTNPRQFGDFVERFEDADDEEIEAIQQDVVDFEPEWNEVLYSGPFVWVEANEEFADRVPNPEHPIAQDWEFYLRTGQYLEEEGMQSGHVDYVHQVFGPEDLPDKYEPAPVSFSGQQLALVFGNNDEYLANNPEVRQALAHAVDFEDIVNTYPPEGTPMDQYQSGIDYGYVQQFVEQDVLDAMTNYTGANTDRAQELLEDQGFSLDNGTWYTPDDEEWSLAFPSADWFTDPGEITSNALNEFGVNTELTLMEFGTWNAEHSDTLDYDITIHLNYGMAREYHAHSDLDAELFSTKRAAVTERELFGEEVEVPEVGNSDGDMVTMNLREELDAIASAESQDEVMEHSTNVAWAHNQLLPGAPIHPWIEHYWTNAGEWNFDLESDAWLTSNRIPHYFLEHDGIQPE